jgi:predicted O-methyltransferase YrrM
MTLKGEYLVKTIDPTEVKSVLIDALKKISPYCPGNKAELDLICNGNVSLPHVLSLHHAIVLISRMYPGGRYFEVGGRGGASLSIALTASPKKTATSMDLWEGVYSGYDNSWKHNQPIRDSLIKEFPETKIEFIRGDSLKLFSDVTGEFDMILVDGAHYYSGVVSDLDNAFRICSDGGVVIVDDLNETGFPEVCLAFNEWTEKIKNNISEIYEISPVFKVKAVKIIK